MSSRRLRLPAGPPRFAGGAAAAAAAAGAAASPVTCSCTSFRSPRALLLAPDGRSWTLQQCACNTPGPPPAGELRQQNGGRVQSATRAVCSVSGPLWPSSLASCGRQREEESRNVMSQLMVLGVSGVGSDDYWLQNPSQPTRPSFVPHVVESFFSGVDSPSLHPEEFILATVQAVCKDGEEY